jgi:hypothetical protein
MGRRLKSGRVKKPREVDDIKVDRSEDVRVGSRWVNVGVQAIHPYATAEAVCPLDNHNFTRHMDCFQKTTKQAIKLS